MNYALDGTLARREFIEAVKPIRNQMKALLTEGVSYEIGHKEKPPLVNTMRTCQRLL